MRILGSRPRTLKYLWWTAFLAGLWIFLTLSSFAQVGIGGWPLELYGMVQVEPGSNVITLGVKDEEIRFVVHTIRSSDRDFTTTRFLSDIKHRTPALYIKGPEMILDMLLKEKPSKRALRIRGVFYPDSRMFIVNSLKPFTEEMTPQRDF